MTAIYRTVDALGRERMIEIVIDAAMYPPRPEVTVESDIEEAIRRC
jgi:hypothetical protein